MELKKKEKMSWCFFSQLVLNDRVDKKVELN